MNLLQENNIFLDTFNNKTSYFYYKSDNDIGLVTKNVSLTSKDFNIIENKLSFEETPWLAKYIFPFTYNYSNSIELCSKFTFINGNGIIVSRKEDKYLIVKVSNVTSNDYIIEIIEILDNGTSNILNTFNFTNTPGSSQFIDDTGETSTTYNMESTELYVKVLNSKLHVQLNVFKSKESLVNKNIVNYTYDLSSTLNKEYFHTPSNFGLYITSPCSVWELAANKPDFKSERTTSKSYIKFSEPKYKVFLCDSFSMKRIEDITDSSNKSLQLLDNKAGQFSCTMPLDSKMAEKVEPISTCILVYKNNKPVWSGPIWSTNENIVDNKIDVTSAGWLSVLEKRKLRRDKTYTNLSAGEIINQLFAEINAQKGIDPNYNIQGFFNGYNAQSDPIVRTKTFEKGTSMLDAINSLIETEAGCNVWVHPLYKTFYSYPWNYRAGQYPPYPFDYIPNPKRIFKYNKDDANLTQLIISTDAAEITNHLLIESDGPSGFSGDINSQKKYSLFEEHVNISSMSVANLLAAYGEAEILYKKKPRIKYSITPFVNTEGSNTPEPLVDYWPGDICKLWAYSPPRIKLDKISVKINSINIKIDDEGNEIVESLELYQ